MADSGDSYNGYKGLLLLNKRFDSKTAASLLQTYLEVVHADKLKGSSEVIAGVQKWERKVGELAQRYGEKLSDNLKMAILVGILPKDFQDMVFQNGVLGTGKMEYQEIRDYVVKVADQKTQLNRPTPMDIGAVNQNEWCWEDYQGSFVESNTDGWGG